MAADEKIIIDVEVTGVEAAEAKIAGLGAAGAKASAETAAAAVSSGAALEGMSARVAAAMTAAQTGATGAAQATTRWGAAVAGLNNAFGGATARVRGFIQQIGGLNDASDQAGKSLNNTNSNAVHLGQTLRLLGRAARIPELSQLGRSLGVVGRAATLAIPLIAVAGLEKVASAAATANEKITDLAAKLGLTNEQFRQLATIGSAVGLNAEKTAAAFQALKDAAAKSAENVQKNTDANKALDDAFQQTRQRLADIQRGFEDLQRTGVRTFRDLQAASEDSSTSFVRTLRGIRERRQEVLGSTLTEVQRQRRALRDLDEQEADARRTRAAQLIAEQEKLEDAQRTQSETNRKLNEERKAALKQQDEAIEKHRKEQIEVQKNATAYDILGVAVSDAQGKLLPVPELLNKVADALASEQDASKLARAELKLTEDGFGRLIPVLKRGSDGLKKFNDEGARLHPPDPKIKTILDSFSIAAGQVSEAFAGLRDAIGAAVSPAFIQLFENFRDLIVEIRPGVAEFAGAISGVLIPVLNLLITIVRDVVVPLFKGIASFFQVIADGINKMFGTNVTSMEVFVAALLIIATACGSVLAAVALLAAGFNLLFENMEKVKSFFAELIPDFDRFIDRVLFASGPLGALFVALRKIIALGGGGGGDVTAGGGGGFADGGHVTGPGTGRSDSILSWLSNGEFVVNAFQTRVWRPVLEAINKGTLNPAALAGFAAGGFVSALSAPVGLGGLPAFADGGPVGNVGGRPLVLNIGGEAFHLNTRDEDTAKRLTNYALTRRMRSGGRRQGG